MDSSYTLIPDTDINMNKQASIFKAIMKKCKCKMSGCKSLECPCKKDGALCSSFCECQSCINVKDHVQKNKEVEDDEESSSSEEEQDQQSDGESEEETTQGSHNDAIESDQDSDRNWGKTNQFGENTE